MTRKLPGPGPLASVRLAWGLWRDPFSTFHELHRRYGEACRIGYGPLRFAFFFGPETTEALLTTDSSALSWREATKFLIPVDGDTALIVSDGEEHRRRRRLVQPAFATRRIRDHLPLVLEEVDRVIDGWTPGTVVDAHAELKRAVRRIVIRALFGEHLRERADEIGDLLEPGLEFVNRTPTRQYRLPFPGTAYRRTVEGRAVVAAIVRDEIERRRVSDAPPDGHDVLGMLLAERDQDGSALTDEEVVDQVISLIAAGYETTGAAVGWAVYAMTADPEVWRRASAEVNAVLGDAAPTNEALASLRYVDGVVSETLRIYSPASAAGRKTVIEVEVAGYRVPAGTTVAYVPHVTHRMEEVWPEPMRFEPDRWMAGGDDPLPHPYAYVPFGGGYRRCIGFALALLEIKTAVTRLVQRTRLTLAGGEPGLRGIAAMEPHPGVPVRVDEVRLS